MSSYEGVGSYQGVGSLIPPLRQAASLACEAGFPWGTSMNLHLSRAEINWRLWLYITLSVDSFLMTNEWFSSHVPPWLMVGLGALNAGLIVVRSYIDKSPAQGAPQAPVPVVGPDGGAVPVKEEEKAEPKNDVPAASVDF